MLHPVYVDEVPTRRAGRRPGGEAHQHVAAVGDRAVGEHPLDVHLHQAQHVADRHAQRRQHPEQANDLRRDHNRTAADRADQLDDRHHAAGLGHEGEEGGDRRGGALVDVAGVGVERNRGDLERESGKQHHHRQHPPLAERRGRGERRDLVGSGASRGLEGGADVAQLGQAGRAVQVAEAEQHQRRRHRAQEEVLDARLLRRRQRAGNRHHDVSRDARQLDGQEQQDDVVGDRDEHHSGERQEHQGEELARVGAEVERARAGRVGVGRPGQQHQQQPNARGQQLDVVGEGGLTDGVPRVGGGSGRARYHDRPHLHREHARQRRQRQHGCEPAGRDPGRDADQEQHARHPDQDQLGQEDFDQFTHRSRIRVDGRHRLHRGRRALRLDRAQD